MTIWSSMQGVGNSRCIESDFGLPKSEPKWVRDVPRVVLGEEFVADEGSVYYRDNDSTLYALDLDSVAQRRTTASAERSSSNVEVNGDNLLFASTVYSLKTQKVEVDFLATEFPFGRRT